MYKLIIIVLAVFALAACKDKYDSAISDISDFKDKMCACQDSACTQKVQEEYRAWRRSMREKFGKDDKPSKEQDQKFRSLVSGLESCGDKFRPDGAGGPGPLKPPAPAGSGAATP
jgi:hypothetical protein